MELTRLMNVLQALWGASLGQGTDPSSAAATVREVHLHPRLPMAVVQHASAEAFGASVPIGRLPAAAAAAARRLLSLSVLRLSHPTAPITAAASHSRLSFWSGPQTGCAILSLQPEKRYTLLAQASQGLLLVQPSGWVRQPPCKHKLIKGWSSQTQKKSGWQAPIDILLGPCT